MRKLLDCRARKEKFYFEVINLSGWKNYSEFQLIIVKILCLRISAKEAN